MDPEKDGADNTIIYLRKIIRLLCVLNYYSEKFR